MKAPEPHFAPDGRVYEALMTVLPPLEGTEFAGAVTVVILDRPGEDPDEAITPIMVTCSPRTPGLAADPTYRKAMLAAAIATLGLKLQEMS